MEGNVKISIKELSLKIGEDTILEDINAEFESGKIYGLIGRNGSGKTMLMKCVCGYIRPTSGEIWVEGKKLGKDMDFPDNLGVIIEVPGFIPYYSGMKNLMLLAGLRGKIGKEEVREAIERVGQMCIRDRFFREYHDFAGSSWVWQLQTVHENVPGTIRRHACPDEEGISALKGRGSFHEIQEFFRGL